MTNSPGSGSKCWATSLLYCCWHRINRILWLHADCAYGGALAIVPDYRSYFIGLESVHSFVMNPHKWLFVPIECSA